MLGSLALQGPETVNFMGAFKYIQESFEKSYRERSPSFKKRISSWKNSRTVERVANPTNPLRARALGYKAKKGYVVVRVKMARGKRARRKPDQGRKPGKTVKFRALGRSLSYYAEEKAARRYPNLCVLNSYLVGEDGVNKYFEVLMKTPQA